MRFLADMGVSQRVIAWLRSQGHDAKHLREEGLHRLPNGEIFQKAVAENGIVLTFDLDFAEIIALCHGKKTSVILFRLHDCTSVHVIERLKKVLADAVTALSESTIIVVEESRHRTRHFPPQL